MSALHDEFRPTVLGKAGLPLLLLLSWWQPALAETSGWLVEELAGGVEVRRGEGQWQPLAAGSIHHTPLSIRTGASGRAMLTRRQDTVEIRPDSMLTLTEDAASQGTVVKTLQDLGSALFRLKSKLFRRFEVETPHMVSVVKGTTFIVRVARQFTSVALVEGSVDVAELDGAVRLSLAPGQVAVKDGDQALRILDDAPAAEGPAAIDLKGSPPNDSVFETRPLPLNGRGLDDITQELEVEISAAADEGLTSAAVDDDFEDATDEPSADEPSADEPRGSGPGVDDSRGGGEQSTGEPDGAFDPPASGDSDDDTSDDLNADDDDGQEQGTQGQSTHGQFNGPGGGHGTDD